MDINKKSQEVFQPAEELNLAEFPFCLISGRVTENSESHIWVSRETTMTDGKIVTIHFTVSGSSEHGLPIGGDQDIYVAIMAAWARSGFQNKVIEFKSVYALLKSVGIQPDGHGYDHVKTALKRFCGVLCTAEKSWWDVKSRKRKSAVGFHLFESFYLKKISEDDDNDGPCHIVASDFLYDSVKNGNTKPLNMETYKALSTPLAKRLYRYLDQQRRACRRKHWTVSLRKIQSILPLSEQYDSAQVKRYLSRALDDLVRNGFLKSFKFFKNENKENIMQAEFVAPHQTSKALSSDEDVRRAAIAQEIAEELNDEANIAYHLRVMKTLPEAYVFRALSETRDAKNRGIIKTSMAQYYVDFLQRNCSI